MSKKVEKKTANTNGEAQSSGKECAIFATCPVAEKMWDYSRNAIKPEEVRISSEEKIYWICENGHSFERSVHSFMYQTKACPECQRLSTTVSGKQHMLKFWDFEKNKSTDITKVSAKSKDFVYWKCPKCGYEWEATIRTRKTDLCPCCDSGMKIVSGINDFCTAVPGLASDYDEALNPGVDATTIGIGSHIKLTWRCHICGYVWEAPVYSRRKITKTGYSVKKCPVCGKNKRAITFDEQYPDLVGIFPEKENGCRLSDLKGTDYGKTYKWNCYKHGSFDQRLSAMIRAIKSQNNGCPYCHGSKVKPEDSFGAKHPDLVKEWALGNGISPYEVTEYSAMEAEWICEKGHKWKASVGSRSLGYKNCRDCFPLRKDTKSFSDLYPEMKSRYSENNNIPFEGRSCYSVELVLWTCNQGHEFEESFYSIHAKGHLSCNICNFRKIIPGLNDLQTLYPQIADDFDTEKNIISVNQISPKSTDAKIFWICKKGHRFQRSARTHVFYRGACPVCSRRVLVKGENDLLTAFPEISKVWDYFENDKNPEDCFDTLNNKYQFTCDEGHHYSATVKQMISAGYKCLVCEDIIALKGSNSLMDTHPILANEWSLNNYRTPEDFVKESSRRVEWVCLKCGGQYYAKINERAVGDDSCPYCNNERVLIGFNDLATTHPDLADEWSLSNTRSPETVTKSFSGKIKWQCSDCGGEYSAPVSDREFGDDSCPYCNKDRVLLGYNDLVTTSPDLVKEWSPSNDRLPETVTKLMSLRVSWVCLKCQGEYVAYINLREAGDDFCPYCAGRRINIGYNDLRTTHPKLAEEWSSNNERGPETAMKSSSMRVLWRCPTCGGEYMATIVERDAGDDACPYCAGRRLLAGLNDLATTHPNLAREWSENNNRSADSVFKTFGHAVLWRCSKCGGEYRASPRKREDGDDSCPYCINLRLLPGLNDLRTTDPELTKEWSPRNERGPETVSKSHKITAFWICPECGGEYAAQIFDREVGDDSCPFCNEGRFLSGLNDLATTHPGLAREWSSANERGPKTVSKSHKLRAFWICPECKGEYSAQVFEREVGDDSCPYCNEDRLLAGLNDLATTHPGLAREWSSTNERGPETVSKSHKLRAFWICPECKGEYAALVFDREVGDDLCPYCTDKKPLPGYNTFLVKYPDLMKEWASIENCLISLDADSITEKFSGNVWWECPSCRNKYFMALNDRVKKKKRGHEPCPRCSGRRQQKIHFI